MRTGILLPLLLLGACASPNPRPGTLPDELLRSTSEPIGVMAPEEVSRLQESRPQAEPWRPRNCFDFMVGGSYWDGLGDLDPSGVSPFPNAFGDFDRWGFAFSMGYDRVVSHGDRTDVTLGMETGWSTFENNGNGLLSPYTTISSTLFYIAPVTRLMIHVSPIMTVSPGIGAGYYGFSIDEYETYYYGWWWGYSGRTLNRDDAFGGFLSLGIDLNLSPSSAIRFDNKVHLVDFGGLESLMPNESSVGGPIWTFEVGFVVEF